MREKVSDSLIEPPNASPRRITMFRSQRSLDHTSQTETHPIEPPVLHQSLDRLNSEDVISSAIEQRIRETERTSFKVTSDVV